MNASKCTAKQKIIISYILFFVYIYEIIQQDVIKSLLYNNLFTNIKIPDINLTFLHVTQIKL